MRRKTIPTAYADLFGRTEARLLVPALGGEGFGKDATLVRVFEQDPVRQSAGGVPRVGVPRPATLRRWLSGRGTCRLPPRRCVRWAQTLTSSRAG